MQLTKSYTLPLVHPMQIAAIRKRAYKPILTIIRDCKLVAIWVSQIIIKNLAQIFAYNPRPQFQIDKPIGAPPIVVKNH